MHRLAQPTDLEAVHAIYMHEEVVPGFEHEGTLRAACKRAGQAHCVDELLMARLLVPLPQAGVA